MHAQCLKKTTWTPETKHTPQTDSALNTWYTWLTQSFFNALIAFYWKMQNTQWHTFFFFYKKTLKHAFSPRVVYNNYTRYFILYLHRYISVLNTLTLDIYYKDTCHDINKYTCILYAHMYTGYAILLMVPSSNSYILISIGNCHTLIAVWHFWHVKIGITL